MKASVAITVRSAPLPSEPPIVSQAQTAPDRKNPNDATKRTQPRPIETHVKSSSTPATVPVAPTSPPVVPTSPPIVAAAPPVVTPTPAPEVIDCHSQSYKEIGLPHGSLTWTGTLQQHKDLVIVDDPKTQLRGQHLPRCEVSVRSLTNGVRVTEQPQRSDGFRRVAIHNDSDAVLPEVRLRWDVK